MSEANVQEYIRAYTEDYMGKVFYYCLRRTGDAAEAEDLSQDIALCVLHALSRGMIPEHFSAWVWRVAHNRYAHWAKDKRRVRENTTSDDVDEYDIPADETPADAYIRDEELSLLRRELAFISSDYRSIVVAHYLQDRSVREIAASLGIPEGTVKTRLFRARNILKEGMNMARTFGKRSYEPEQITFVNNCSPFGDNGQPWTILHHSLYKNIFLQAYDNPSTAEELALELGIALPYMEEELNYLVNETFLVYRDGKYETDFPIISREAQIKIDEASRAATRRITALLEEYVDAHRAELYTGNISYENAKWALLMWEFDRYGMYVKQEYPHRPNGGRWDIVGFETANIPTPAFVGMNGAMVDLPENWTGNFWNYDYKWDRIGGQHFLSDEATKLLLLILAGRATEYPPELIKELIDTQYIRPTETGYEPTVTTVSMNQRPPKSPELQSIFDEVNATLSDIVRDDLSSRYYSDKVMNFVDYSRGYVLEQAIADGWLTYNDQTIKSVGAMLVL